MQLILEGNPDGCPIGHPVATFLRRRPGTVHAATLRNDTRSCASSERPDGATAPTCRLLECDGSDAPIHAGRRGDWAAQESASAVVLHHGKACANRTPEFGRGTRPSSKKIRGGLRVDGPGAGRTEIRVGEYGTGGRGLSRIDGSVTLRTCALRACARAGSACRGRDRPWQLRGTPRRKRRPQAPCREPGLFR